VTAIYRSDMRSGLSGVNASLINANSIHCTWHAWNNHASSRTWKL